MDEGREHKFHFKNTPVKLTPMKGSILSAQDKLFVDPIYGTEKLTKLIVNGISLTGKWEAETEDVGDYDYILRFYDQLSNNSISFTFTCPEDRLKAIEKLESNQEIPHAQPYHHSVTPEPFYKHPTLRQRNLAFGIAGLIGVIGAYLLVRKAKKKKNSLDN